MALEYARREFTHHPDYDGNVNHCLYDEEKDELISTTSEHRRGPGVETIGNGRRAENGGGVRVDEKCTEEKSVTHSLRLSRAMSLKAAMVGEKVGGAKTVVRWKGDREQLWEAFAKKVLPHIPGYVIAEDSNFTWRDKECIKHYAPDALVAGTTADTDPSPTTADGIILGIESMLQIADLLSPRSIRDTTFAVSGAAGKVGGGVLRQLWDRGASCIYVADPRQKELSDVWSKCDGVQIVPVDEVHAQNADVFVPCALGGSLNKKTVSELKCRLIAGAENNQLAHVDIGEVLHKRGISYATDYVINAGGLIKVFSLILKDRSIDKVLPQIGYNLQHIFAKSRFENRAASVVAEELAVERVKRTMFLPK